MRYNDFPEVIFTRFRILWHGKGQSTITCSFYDNRARRDSFGPSRVSIELSQQARNLSLFPMLDYIVKTTHQTNQSVLRVEGALEQFCSNPASSSYRTETADRKDFKTVLFFKGRRLSGKFKYTRVKKMNFSKGVTYKNHDIFLPKVSFMLWSGKPFL